jgi:hypothetical protein
MTKVGGAALRQICRNFGPGAGLVEALHAVA